MTNDYYVYILKCADDSYYTGVTNNLERRIIEHQDGLIPNCYTHNRRPITCVYSQHYTDINQAIISEKQIKGWSRKKKEALVKGDYTEIVRLSNVHASTSSA